MWVVTVTGNGCYQYGPFDSFGAADDWAEKNANAFYGRIVTVHKLELIAPFN